jgi:hypothetical protein
MIHLLTLKQFNNELPSNGAGWNTSLMTTTKTKTNTYVLATTLQR